MAGVGEKAPDFELLNQDGNPVKLSDFRGKRVILFAYPKAGTSGCTVQACGFADAFPRITDANTVVLGISPDELSDQRAWKEKEGLPYDLLSDPDHKVLEAYGAWGEKKRGGETRMGVLRSHWVIDENGNIADAQINVSPEASVEKATTYIAEHA